jgi:hypothetical protein
MAIRASFQARWGCAGLLLGAVAVMSVRLSYAQSSMQMLEAACADDARKFCAGVQPGGGRIIACLKQHKDGVSNACKQAAAASTSASAGSPGTATGPGTAAEPGSAAGPTGTSSIPAPNVKASGRRVDTASYLVMKKAQITGPGPDAAHPTMPAYDLLIPSTWKVQGGVAFGGGSTGCFADIYAISLRATSADESMLFAAGPDTTWQYADDPSVLKSLNDPSRRALGVGGKPCPVEKPMKAEYYIRQHIVTLYPAGTTVVSIESYPALNEIVRKRQGLRPSDANTGSVRTEAVRARLAYQKDGKDFEDWVAVAVVVNISQAGRGSFYDSHATSLVQFRAPKGKLDANETLFQVLVSSLQPEPQWVAYSSGVLTKLYQMQAQKTARIDQMWSQFYTHAAQTLNGETANAMRGADASVFHEDQNIRGVQTFRDPATGKTQELSNLYDHAWQDGTNDYILSNDPNFNPNEHVSGDWSELQAVNP